MRILPLLLLTACGGGDLGWWLTADRANAEVGNACIGEPLHDVHGYARLWTGDARALDVLGATYTGPATGYDLALSWVWDTGRRVDGDFALDLEGGVLRGDWRYDETSASDVTCATSAPVTLHPIRTLRGTWELSGNLVDGTVSPEGCRGALADSPFTVLVEAYDLSDGRVGAWMSPDPLQSSERFFAGTATGKALELTWGGDFDTGTSNTMALSLDGGAASLAWDQDGCVLTLPMTAEAR